ncbi:hypothetical protein FB559_4961 [Actinoallomurus bryophytorum]|uniref:Choice-of-anchor C domain-containing protein n=1 Tax=Actinoallomurus bryophytorum TaxID=1490222 RepID=A0A543CQE3_9ACTN|nr:hypothetical protein [Actinoallomurus bryophytorum]TQL99299.1 hypothetical protein FB559_4961 [Actinoallomurus bryophytorum]
MRRASFLVLATLTVGLLPVSAGAAGVNVAATPTTTVVSPAKATGWSLVGTLDPQHVYAPNTQLVLYGVQAFNSTYAGFDPKVIPASVQQVVVPYVRIPDGESHIYKLVFHLVTAGTTTTRYQLDAQTPVTVATGDTTLEFTYTTPTYSKGAHWFTWSLGNVNNDIWHFHSCAIFEQTS